MKVQVRERDLIITETERLVAQSVNEYTVQFTFDQAWDGYAVEAVFQDQSGVLKAKVISDGAAVIPWEVLQETGYIRIGVFAVTSSNTRPTVWSALIPVYEGAEDGDPSTPAASTPWQEALLQMGQDVTAAAAAKTAAETAQEIAERAAAMAAASSGTATFALNDAGHLIVTWTDTEGTSHNTDIGEVSAYAVAVKNGYSGTEAQWEQYIANASTNAQAAAASKLDAEAYAVGKRGGVDVESTDPTYHNNSKYYSEQAETAKTAAQTAAASASAAYGTDLLADDYSSEKTYVVGEPAIYSGGMYWCAVPITTPEAWTAAHWSEKPVAEAVSNLKSDLDKLAEQVEEDLGTEEETTPTITFTDGYAIRVNGNIGEIYESVNNSVSSKISLNNATGLKCYYFQGTDPYGTYFFYTVDDAYISRGTIENSDTVITIPENADYMRFYCMTSKKTNIAVKVTVETEGTVFSALDGKLEKNQGVENAGKFLQVGVDGELTPAVISAAESTAFVGDVPLFVSMMPDFFWVSTNEIAAFSAELPKYNDGTVKAKNNAWFQISGNQGDSFVTVIPGGNGDVADITEAERAKPFGCVIMYDDGRYYPCNAQYLTDTTFSVWPPLKANITSGELAQIRTGIHLSRRGYRAYAQNLYAAEPKHCEKPEYIAKWRVNDASIPWEYFGAAYTHQVLHQNISSNFVDKLYQDSYIVNKAISHAVSNTDSGISWEVPVDGRTGYVEFYIGILSGPGSLYELDAADAIHCELWLDGVKTAYYDKTIKRLERVCFDFSGAQTAELKIYGSRWQTTDVIFGFALNRITWWVNKKHTAVGGKLFPTGSVVGQLFDSWGEFDDAESAVYLQKEINADASVTVPYFNGSLSDQTSAWGKAWFYNKIWQNHPSVMITNFGINDQISVTKSDWPATVEGPDQKEYDNIISAEEYNENMSVIRDEALSNNIIPVFVGIGLPAYQEYPNNFIDYNASAQN